MAVHERDFTVVTDDVYEIVQNEGRSLPIADPLHFAKSARARVINHPVALVWDEKVVIPLHENPSDVANNGIMARNINFQGFKSVHESLSESEISSQME